MIPLILSFFLLIGTRAILKIPINHEANWIFRVTETKEKQNYFLGIRKGIFFLLLVPMHSVLFMVYAFNWGLLVSFFHCLFCLVVSFIFMEVLFFKSRKIAFTCSYLPGQERMYIFWFVYCVGFLMYINIVSWIEQKLLTNPIAFLVFYGIVVLIYLFMRIYQKVYLNKGFKIKFDESPLVVVQTLDL